MGWLRELMAASEPAIQSYGELARRCLENREWPRDIQPQARSLASLFSKFDRGMEVEWLAERREVQNVLAQTLTLPLRSVEQEVAKHLDQADRNLYRYRFADAPNLRPIDLREENLPPVFDERLRRPGLWQKLWWVAEAGSGQDLVAKWLCARSLAESATLHTWDDVLRTSASGLSPLFVEYLGESPPQEQLQGLGERPMCIASNVRPRDGFVVIPGIDLQAVEDRFLDWLDPLWVDKAAVSRPALKEWLGRIQSLGLGRGLEAMLGLVSLACEAGLEKLDGLAPASLVELFLTKAIEQAAFKTASESSWLKENVRHVLRGIARNALATRLSDWNTPLTQAEWLALVPSEYQRGVDAEWTRVSLQQAGAPLTVSELEKALKAVPPGGFRVIESLRAAALLRENTEAKLALKPRWLADYFESEGYSALLEESADSWGRVALAPERARGIVGALEREYVAAQFQALDAALELDDDESAGYALAIELLVSCSGRWLLHGKELEAEQIGGLLRLQRDQLVHSELLLKGSPTRLFPGPRLLTQNTDLAGWGAWLLAVWALCEHASDVPELSDVNPWSSTSPIDEAALALITRALETESAETVAGTYAMLGRLLQYLEQVSRDTPNVGSIVQACTATPLFAVARVLRGDGWEAWNLALQAPLGLESLRRLSKDEAWPTLAKTAWRTWSEKGCPVSGMSLFANNERKDLFWPHLPDRVLRALLDERHPIVRQVPADCMKAEWITMYLERVPEERDVALQYLEVIPTHAITDEHFEVLFELLEAHDFAERVAGLWESHDEAAYARMVSLLDGGKAHQAAVWLTTLPETQLGKFVAHLRGQLERVGTRYPSFETCRAWLHNLCCRRAPGWLGAYDLFAEMEVRRKRVARIAPTTIKPPDSP